MANDFTKIMEIKTDYELIEIITELREEYQPEAVIAAQDEIKNRNLFKNNIDQNELELDVEILLDGSLCLYHSENVLDKDLEWFKLNNYTINDIDTINWTIKKAHLDLKETLRFPDYYGENLDAFNDCLGDIYADNYKGQVIVFRNFDKIYHKEKQFCDHLLDIIATQSREWLVSGHRLIGLIQVNETAIEFSRVGGYTPSWNPKEWLSKSRGIK